MTSVLCNNELNIFFFYSQFSCGDDDDVDANKNYYYGGKEVNVRFWTWLNKPCAITEEEEWGVLMNFISNF